MSTKNKRKKKQATPKKDDSKPGHGFKPITTLTGRFPQPKAVGDPYKCVCGSDVQTYEAELIGGPNKGKKITVTKGCRCEEIQLAKEIQEHYERLKQQRALETFEIRSLVPPVLKGATFENFQVQNESQQIALEALRLFVENFNRDECQNIILTGMSGRGKSHLAFSAAMELINRDYSAIFVDVPQLFSKIKATFRQDSQVSEGELLEALKDADLLVLDDIGAEATTEWRKDILFQIINSRGGKHTIYTTNFTNKDIYENLDGRTYSRINHNLDAYEITGNDWRMRR